MAIAGVVLWHERGDVREPLPAAIPVDGGQGAQPADDAVARHATSQGEAAVELVLLNPWVEAGDELVVEEVAVFHLVNRGDVPVRTGVSFEVERWDGEAWQEVAPVDSAEGGWAWPGVGVELAPGGTTVRQRWPVQPWGPAEPGRYRLTKTAEYVDPDDAGMREEVRATASFRIGQP